jgi:hypothetical protein
MLNSGKGAGFKPAPFLVHTLILNKVVVSALPIALALFPLRPWGKAGVLVKPICDH